MKETLGVAADIATVVVAILSVSQLAWKAWSYLSSREERPSHRGEPSSTPPVALERNEWFFTLGIHVSAGLLLGILGVYWILWFGAGHDEDLPGLVGSSMVAAVIALALLIPSRRAIRERADWVFTAYGSGVVIGVAIGGILGAIA